MYAHLPTSRHVKAINLLAHATSIQADSSHLLYAMRHHLRFFSFRRFTGGGFSSFRRFFDGCCVVTCSSFCSMAALRFAGAATLGLAEALDRRFPRDRDDEGDVD